MHNYNFWGYSEKAEEPGGDYWKFLEASEEEFEKSDIWLMDIKTIIEKIKNEDLKRKMKEKCRNLILKNGLDFRGIEKSLSMFSQDEIKNLIEHCFDKLKYRDYATLMYLFKLVDDQNWEYMMIKKILDILKNENIQKLIHFIEWQRRYPDIYSKLLSDYCDYFPEPYKKYLEMQKDENYVYKKSLQFIDKDIDIGIDSRIKIAPEIEANKVYDISIDLGNQKGFDDYYVGSEATVPNGNEVNHRTFFHNTKEEVAKFCGLCEAMKDIGYYYDEKSENAAGQINLGLDYLDTKEAILNFFEIYGNSEELLYYISSEEGQLFRQMVFSSSRIKPLSEIVGRRVLDEDLTRSDVISLFNVKNYGNDDASIDGLMYKKNSVCLRGTSEKDYRLEFKIPNGGCNYQTWIDNIRLYGKMLEVAKKIADMKNKDYLTAEEEHLLRLKIDLQDESLSLEEKLTILMDLLFKDERIKQIYINRYRATIRKIKETNSTKYNRSYYQDEPAFAEVEFLEEYQNGRPKHSRFEPDYLGESVAEYDPETGEMIINSQRKK